MRKNKEKLTTEIEEEAKENKKKNNFFSRRLNVCDTKFYAKLFHTSPVQPKPSTTTCIYRVNETVSWIWPIN